MSHSGLQGLGFPSISEKGKAVDRGSPCQCWFCLSPCPHFYGSIWHETPSHSPAPAHGTCKPSISCASAPKVGLLFASFLTLKNKHLVLTYVIGTHTLLSWKQNFWFPVLKCTVPLISPLTLLSYHPASTKDRPEIQSDWSLFYWRPSMLSTLWSLTLRPRTAGPSCSLWSLQPC